MQVFLTEGTLQVMIVIPKRRIYDWLGKSLGFFNVSEIFAELLNLILKSCLILSGKSRRILWFSIHR